MVADLQRIQKKSRLLVYVNIAMAILDILFAVFIADILLRGKPLFFLVLYKIMFFFLALASIIMANNTSKVRGKTIVLMNHLIDNRELILQAEKDEKRERAC
jgi:hypothetical protein